MIQTNKKKTCPSAWYMVGFLSVFFFLKDNVFADEGRREAGVHEVTRLISVVPHWHARIWPFFHFLFLFFESSCPDG